MVCFDLIGWMAAALTLSAYTMRTMIPLRLTAIAASLFFVAYGALMQIYPMLVLHMLLLPFNSHRLFEIFRTARKIHVARSQDEPMAASICLARAIRSTASASSTRGASIRWRSTGKWSRARCSARSRFSAMTACAPSRRAAMGSASCRC